MTLIVGGGAGSRRTDHRPDDGVIVAGISHCASERSMWASRAGWEFERRDPRMPISVGIRRYVLSGVPERTAVGWVNLHGAVVAPAVEGARLRAATGDDRRLTLRELSRWVAGEPPRNADRWEGARARHREADGDV